VELGHPSILAYGSRLSSDRRRRPRIETLVCEGFDTGRRRPYSTSGDGYAFSASFSFTGAPMRSSPFS